MIRKSNERLSNYWLILSFFIKFCDNTLTTVIFQEISVRVHGDLTNNRKNIECPSKTEKEVCLSKLSFLDEFYVIFKIKTLWSNLKLFLQVSRRFEQKYERSFVP